MAGGADDPAGRADLERLAGDDRRRWEAVAQAYQAALPQVPAAALELRRRLATICGERLGALDRAVAWWDEVAAVDPGPEPLTALVRLRRRQGAKRELVAALLRLAEATPAPESKKELLFEVAKIMDEQLANREGAIEAYRKILSIDPEDPGALRLLGRLLGVAERWEELAAVMEREADSAASADPTPPPRRPSCVTGWAGSARPGSPTRWGRWPPTARCWSGRRATPARSGRCRSWPGPAVRPRSTPR